ncbi:EAL domain-containing protein [Novosphingobium sp. FSY-8]|uniref:EAL domain-containing protein n=1 Tax=Novosphingobium ovatum TaxID=1908523 RepID=A0ABW9X9K8_9SPHN|nr:EAL domain-containing protein [Novosphingobium ovatum]NBC35211.1 EAL domain-containing protein [Novosphingobium ovatum]
MARRGSTAQGAQALDGATGVVVERRKDSSPVPLPGVDIARLRRRSDADSRMAEPYPGYFFISEGWAMTSPAMGMAIALLALNEMHLPGVMATALLALAITVSACGPLFVRFERSSKRSAAMRYMALVAGVALPMVLFGAGLVVWQANREVLDSLELAGQLLVVGLVASVALSGRMLSLVLATVALWSVPVLCSGSAGAVITLFFGGVVGAIATIHQARLDRAAQAELREKRRKQLRAEEFLADFELAGLGWFWETDRQGLLTYVSPHIYKQLNREADSLQGRPLTDLFVLDGNGCAEGERTLQFHLTARSPFQDVAVRAATQVEERWWSVTGRPAYDAFNNFLGFRGAGSDLTEQRRSEQHATRLAHFDSLTGLANRFQMSQSLEKILTAPKIDHRDCAVFLLDLDRFKHVNDTMGHPAGDALLKQVANRLQNTVGDMGRVGRLGGDEFQVILPGRIAREQLAALADRIIGNLSQPYSIDDKRVVIGASVGIALSPDDGMTSEDVIRNADLALYAAKDRGRGCHHFYAEDLHSDAEERRQLEHDLREALSHGGLELHYQPVVHTGTEKITGFEALLRWNHPRLGRLSPAKFVPIAEDCGLIAPIGEWALRTACHDLSRWPESVRVAVNVSPLQFANPSLPGIVTNALAAAQVDPARLELEITESVFLNDSADTDAMFTALKRIGVRLALDDFGTGYSSLGYLQKAPFDKIKIDQGFVRGATMAGNRNSAIIAAIVSLADALGMETTAEGVETLDELELVRALGCSHVQGYIYAKPLTRLEADERTAGDLRMVASGPRAARPVRRSMLRKVNLESDGERYPVTIRNISSTGAMFEGLLDVPIGLEANLEMSEDMVVQVVVRWSKYGRTGVAFLEPMAFDESGTIVPQRVLDRNAPAEAKRRAV